MNRRPAARPPSTPKEKTAPGPLRQVPLRPLVVRVVGQPGLAHPDDALRRRPATRRPRWALATCAVHPLGQRLHALQQQEGVERRQRRRRCRAAARRAAWCGSRTRRSCPTTTARRRRRPVRSSAGSCRCPSRSGRTRRPRRPAWCRDRRGTWWPSGRRCRRRARSAGTGRAWPASSRRPAGCRRRGPPRRGPRGRRCRRTGWRRPRCRQQLGVRR